jgi:hypothetical protein
MLQAGNRQAQRGGRDHEIIGRLGHIVAYSQKSKILQLQQFQNNHLLRSIIAEPLFYYKLTGCLLSCILHAVRQLL